jgi:hypothetical protein
VIERTKQTPARNSLATHIESVCGDLGSEWGMFGNAGGSCASRGYLAAPGGARSLLFYLK